MSEVKLKIEEKYKREDGKDGELLEMSGNESSARQHKTV